jgi:hypothetical protein
MINHFFLVSGYQRSRSSSNSGDTEGVSYPDQIELPPIAASEVEDAIIATAPNKAPGPDGITNKALRVGVEIVNNI